MMGKYSPSTYVAPPWERLSSLMRRQGDYELAHLMTKNGTMSPLFFDTKSSKFCTVARGNPNLLYLDSDDQSKFPEAYPDRDPLYAGFPGRGDVGRRKRIRCHAEKRRDPSPFHPSLRS